VQFFTLQTTRDHLKDYVDEMYRQGRPHTVSKAHERVKTMDYRSYYRYLLENNSNHEVCVGLESELRYLDTGKPYYKVYPAMASMMSDVSIDIPVQAIPFPYDAFAILLADDPANDIRDEGGPLLKWALVYKFKTYRIDDVNFSVSPRYPGHLASEALHVNFEFNQRRPDYEPMQFHNVIPLDVTQSVASLMDEDWEGFATEYPHEYMPTETLYKRMMSLVIATCFFGVDRHEVVLPDLPRKKLDAKIRTHGEAAVGKIREERADGRKWTIGREITLPKPIAAAVDHTSVAGSRFLSHRYVRRGHMRYQAVGEGRTKRTLIFVHPHMCGDSSLPLKQHGFRISGE